MKKYDKNNDWKFLAERTGMPSDSEWERGIQERLQQYKRAIRKNRNGHDNLLPFDLCDSLLRRRKQAILRTMPEIYRRYKASEKALPLIGETWLDLNLGFDTYSRLDANYHILFGASIWILNQITKNEDWRKLYRLLPKDEECLDELEGVVLWHAKYEYDLIASVEYVLYARNPFEKDGNDYPRTLTSEYLAEKHAGKQGKQRTAGPDQNRKNYEALIEMLPREAIDAAVEQFRKCFWEWADRFYAGAEPFLRANEKYYEKARSMQLTVRELRNEFQKREKTLRTLSKQNKKGNPPKRIPNPLLRNPELSVPDLLKPAGAGARIPSENSLWLGQIRSQMSEQEKALNECLDLLSRTTELSEKIDTVIGKLENTEIEFLKFQQIMVRGGRIFSAAGPESFGEIAVSPMEPLRISDPYALCFALLYLIEADDDLPWLYGAGCGLMSEAAEALPWGVTEFDEFEDEVWIGQIPRTCNTRLPKSISIPDLYERSYQMKGEEADFPRSLAQIVYEETGCVLPDDLHIYDDRAKMLGKYGIRGKDAASLLMLMSTAATMRHSLSALNLNPDICRFLDADPANAPDTNQDSSITSNPSINSKEESSPEDQAVLKEEIRRLKAALHTSEKENRETKKALAGIRAAADREHRELADLREYVFNQTDTVNEEDASDEGQWPYDVQKDTIVFGGHATWLKGIKSLLTGRIRYIDKDFVFNTDIIKHAEVLWIQPNALSHTTYNRIMDHARAYGKAVRYFTFASWSKCARQLMEEDQR